ncbi:MAG: bifunctional diguanylate cyclase/phosphohydrolase [Campylobacterota bacterium]
MRFKSIRYKLFFLIFATVLLLATALMLVMTNVLKNITKQNYYEFSKQEFVQIESFIQRVASEVKNSTDIIAADTEVILSVNLIDKYEKRFDYKNETFNAQKKKLTGILERYEDVALSSYVALFNSKKQMLSFVAEDQEGIVRYDGGKPVVQTLQGGNYTPPFDTDILTRKAGEIFFTNGKNLYLNYIRKINNDDTHVGYVLSSVKLDQLVFESLKDENFCLLLQTPEATFQSQKTCQIPSSKTLQSMDADELIATLEDEQHFIYRYNSSLGELGLVYIASKQNYHATLTSLQKQLFVIILLITLAVALITYIFTKKIFLDPFKRFYEGFQQLQKGNYEHEITVESDDEIKHLAQAFNDMSRRIYKSDAEKTQNYEEVILAMVDIIEQRDTYTAGHSKRVAHYCKLIAQTMGLEPHTVAKLYKAAMLHDIGKVQTPDSILLKPAKLSSLEYTLIKEHVSVSDDILDKLTMYKDLAKIVKYHHERFDGKGYPFGKKGKDIPLLSRIMIVADAFDAMTTNRIYKPRLSLQEALRELENNSGTQFDPDIVAHAKEALKDVTLPKTGDQLPHSAVERERFAYFFKDKLTHAYNIDYLNTVLNKEEVKEELAYLVRMKNFTVYNKTYGWQAGDRYLIAFVDFIKKHYPKAMIFRVQGDDFVIVSHNLDADFVQAFAGETIEIEVRSISLRNIDSFETLIAKLNE